MEVFLFTDLIALARTRRSTNKLTIIRQLYFLDKVKLLKSQSSDTAIVFIYLDEGKRSSFFRENKLNCNGIIGLRRIGINFYV